MVVAFVLYIRPVYFYLEVGQLVFGVMCLDWRLEKCAKNSEDKNWVPSPNFMLSWNKIKIFWHKQSYLRYGKYYLQAFLVIYCTIQFVFKTF